MTTAICYQSRHHGNTRKVLEAMASAGDADLIDVTSRIAPRLDRYDLVGFASGIYFGRFHETVLRYAEQYLPQWKDVFLVSTYGAPGRHHLDAIRAVVRAKGCPVLGEFGCRGWDTFGPFRLVGGLAKGHPDEEDLRQAAEFFRGLSART